MFQESGVIGNILVPEEINPAFQYRGERPPPDGEDQNDALVALKPCDL